jgi:p-aminobenzoyl-glutamate transporter AbgT
MKKSEPEAQPRDEQAKLDVLEKRGFTWAALVVLLVATLIAALGFAYLITIHNFPAR